jgi:hypothetical protein
MSQQVDYMLDYPALGMVDAAPAGAEASPASRSLGRWLWVAIGLATVMIARELFQWMGIPIPQRVLATGLALLVLASLAVAGIQASRAQYLPSFHGFKGRLVILTLWVVWLAGWGAFRGNFSNMIIKESVGFLMIVVLLLLGRSDAAWERGRTPMILALYVGFVLIVLTMRVPGYATNFEGTKELDIRYATRHLDTIGSSMSGIAPIALLLGAWGLVRRRTDRMRVLLLGSLAIYVIVLVIIFEFRGALATVAELLAVFFISIMIVQKRLRVGTVLLLLLAAGIGFALAYSAGVVSEIQRRFNEPGGLFQSRVDETTAFFKDMGPLDYVVGRGMGGSYNGPNWKSATVINGQRYWFSNHFGFLGWVLRGGVPFLLFAMTFVFPMFTPKPRAWYQNEYNLAALVLTPVLLFNILVNPVDFGPDAFFNLLTWGFCFARFSTPVTEMPQWTEAPPQQISYDY